MNCSFIMHVILETCQLHQIIWRTVGLKKHVQVSWRFAMDKAFQREEG
jgi:hypothetical protein